MIDVFLKVVANTLTDATRAAVDCPSRTVVTGTGTTASVAGSTTAQVPVTCANGYSLGGGTTTVTAVTFKCDPTGLAASAWSPDPLSTFCRRECDCLHCFFASFVVYEVGKSSLSSPHSIFNLLVAAVDCLAKTASTGTGTVQLTGSTTAQIPVTCAAGYSFGGGTDTTTSMTYRCDATGPAASAWSPDPATTFCRRELCLWFVNLKLNFNLNLLTISVPSSIFSRLLPAVNCTTTPLSNSNAASLFGTTGTAWPTTCTNGYSIGGGDLKPVTATYTCTAAASGPAASLWQPAPSATFCQGG